MGIAARLNRWRGSRGYGVHSPLAFSLVKHVLRPSRGVVYYGEEALMATDGLAGRELKRARILLRLVAELQPSFVWISPGASAHLQSAVRLAGEVIRIFDGSLFPDRYPEADLLVLDSFSPSPGQIAEMLATGKSLIAFNLKPEDIEKFKAANTSAIILEGVDSLIAVARPGLSPYIYNVSRF